MGVEKRTIVSHIEPLSDGSLRIHYSLQLYEPGEPEQIYAELRHIDLMEPGTDIDGRIAAINSHLSNGLSIHTGSTVTFPPVEDAGEFGTDRIRMVASIFWTPKVIDSWSAKVEASRIAAVVQE